MVPSRSAPRGCGPAAAAVPGRGRHSCLQVTVGVRDSCARSAAHPAAAVSGAQRGDDRGRSGSACRQRTLQLTVGGCDQFLERVFKAALQVAVGDHEHALLVPGREADLFRHTSVQLQRGEAEDEAPRSDLRGLSPPRGYTDISHP